MDARAALVFAGLFACCLFVVVASLTGFLPRDLWLMGGLLGAGVGLIFVVFRRATRPARTEAPGVRDSTELVIGKMSGLMLMQHNQRITAAAFAPLKRCCVALAAVVIATGISLIAGWKPSPAMDMLMPALIVSIGAIGVPASFFIGLRRSAKLDLRCPKCRAVIVSMSHAGTYEEVLKSGACPKCRQVLLVPSKIGDTASSQ